MRDTEFREASSYELFSLMEKKKKEERQVEKSKVTYYNNLKFHCKVFLLIYSNMTYNIHN